MKLKKYTMEQLSKVKVVLNESELNILKGGYTDLHNGYAELTFDEMLMVFMSIHGFPRYILDELNAQTDVPYNFSEMGTSEARQLFGSRLYVVAANDMGPYSIYWSISSGDSEEGDSSSSEQSTSEEHEPPTVSDFNEIIENYDNTNLATLIVTALIEGNIQAGVDNNDNNISSQLSTIYEELIQFDFPDYIILEHEIEFVANSWKIVFKNKYTEDTVYTYQY
ncbi:MAG: hypothetical protein J5965_24805 [Aeriscardovia sp.]|nr:hypothetical protein [Aeriscardovia sp.]